MDKTFYPLAVHQVANLCSTPPQDTWYKDTWSWCKDTAHILVLSHGGIVQCSVELYLKIQLKSEIETC